MYRQKWIDHKFETGIDVGWTSNILSRVEDTAIRLEYHCKRLNDQQLSEGKNNSWSIKQHIGHLTDLEELWCNRFLEFKALKNELSPADMSNQKTEVSSHNNQSLEALINDFKVRRNNMLTVFNRLERSCQNHQAMHPRIKKMMRPVDLLFFIAEHDDHHISSIIELKKSF